MQKKNNWFKVEVFVDMELYDEEMVTTTIEEKLSQTEFDHFMVYTASKAKRKDVKFMLLLLDEISYSDEPERQNIRI